ncbi:MAG: NAD-dependent epimerase/dehydratase family protein, partial [Acidimicrobiia bacterium]
PRACYDESKRLGETLCYIYRHQHGVNAPIVRPFNVYGPGMSEADYRVLPNFASAIKAGKPLEVYGTGKQTRTYCYVTDAIVGFFLTLVGGRGAEPYNIGNPKPEISVVELIEVIEKVLDRKLDRIQVGYPDSYPGDEPNRRCPKVDKAKNELGFSAIVELQEGLQRYLSWTDSAYTGVRSR